MARCAQAPDKWALKISECGNSAPVFPVFRFRISMPLFLTDFLHAHPTAASCIKPSFLLPVQGLAHVVHGKCFLQSQKIPVSSHHCRNHPALPASSISGTEDWEEGWCHRVSWLYTWVSPPQHYWHLWLHNSFLWRIDLYIMGYLAASLVSTY